MKYNVDVVVKVDNYANGREALFYTYDNCIICDQLKNNMIWEIHLNRLFEKIIKPTDVVLEGGCHIGTHTIKLGFLAKKVYAFEPMQSSFDLLSKNIILNNLDNIVVFKKGLSNNSDCAYYEWIPDNNPGGSGLSNNPMGKLPEYKEPEEKSYVDLITIDSLNLDQLDFIKLDVEGYETLSIYGAIETILKYKPIITLEIWCDHYGGVDDNFALEKFKMLTDIGYKIIHIYGPDYLFIPREKKHVLNNIMY